MKTSKTISVDYYDATSPVPVFLQAVDVKRIVLRDLGGPGAGKAWGMEQPEGLAGSLWIDKSTSDAGKLAVFIHEFLHFLGFDEDLVRQEESKLLVALNIRLPEGEDIRDHEGHR